MTGKGIFDMMLLGTGETLYMTLLATLGGYLLGLPLGLLLIITEPDGIKPLPKCNAVLGAIVNTLRSVPFLILAILLIPFARIVVGTSIGNNATIVYLIIAAFPFIARMVESSIKEVSKGVIEAAQSMGASTFQIIYKVLVPEAMPSLVLGATISCTTILAYSAMAGIVGGRGLGFIAINYGLYRFEPLPEWIAVILLVVLVQIIQLTGNRIAKMVDKR